MKIAVLNLLDAMRQMFGLGGDVLAVQAARQQGDLRMRDSGRAAGGAYAAHDAVEGFFGALFEFSALRIGDVLHDIEVLRAALSAGVAADASYKFPDKAAS